jgi:DNA-binding NtrC family response regulator
MARVLLVDDTPEIAELLSFALRDRGHEVVSTGYADSIGDTIAENRIDALVLDCSVFNMSESLFDEVRSRPELAELPVVIISDTPDVADASLNARGARRILLIPKPFMGSQVARALEDLLGAADGHPSDQ